MKPANHGAVLDGLRAELVDAIENAWANLEHGRATGIRHPWRLREVATVLGSVDRIRALDAVRLAANDASDQYTDEERPSGAVRSTQVRPW